jgi:hypothetical protein
VSYRWWRHSDCRKQFGLGGGGDNCFAEESKACFAEESKACFVEESKACFACCDWFASF